MMLAKIFMFAAVADAARTVRRDQSGAEHATVAATFTFGAPATSRAPLSNPQTPDGCFPGARVWTSDNFFWGSKRDIVPGIFNNNGLYHAKTLAIDLKVTKGDEKRTDFDCSTDNAREPTYGSLSVDLHGKEHYIHGVSVVAPELEKETIIATEISLNQDVAAVAAHVKDLGFGLVGSAFHNGDGLFGGPQASHLIQNPGTLDCLVTFQGSSSFGDWLADADIAPAEFCELPTQVHRGFRNHLRRILTTDSWQNQVRANLPKCNNVYIVGHSLAGAMSELFSACVNTKPLPGYPGYADDYAHMFWTKGTPEKMPYL